MDCYEIYRFLELYVKFHVYIPLRPFFFAAYHACTLLLLTVPHLPLRYNPNTSSTENDEADTISCSKRDAQDYPHLVKVN